MEWIPDKDGKGMTLAIQQTDVERVDPTELYRNLNIERSKALYRAMLAFKNPGFPPKFFERPIEQHAEESWQTQYARISKVELPGALMAALKMEKKSYQEKLLRGIRFTPDMLAAFLFKAHDDLGFTYSKYVSEHLPVDIKEEDMPRLVRIEGEKVITSDYTPLSDGQLKQAVEQRSGIIAHFLDKGDEWHCLFSTRESLAGKENWQGGQPHFHYISDKFGIPREKVVQEVKNRNYALFSLPHIPLDGYR